MLEGDCQENLLDQAEALLAAGDQTPGDRARLGVAGIGFRLTAKNIPRELIEENDKPHLLFPGKGVKVPIECGRLRDVTGKMLLDMRICRV